MQEADLAKLEENVRPTWSDVVEPMERIVDRLSVAWGVVNHLKAVKDSSELRSAVEAVQVSMCGENFLHLYRRSQSYQLILTFSCFLYPIYAQNQIEWNLDSC
jgi:Zn-dependent oligopeptidase